MSGGGDNNNKEEEGNNDNNNTTTTQNHDDVGVADYFAILGVGDDLVWKHTQKQEGQQQEQQTTEDQAAWMERFYREIVHLDVLVVVNNNAASSVLEQNHRATTTDAAAANTDQQQQQQQSFIPHSLSMTSEATTASLFFANRQQQQQATATTNTTTTTTTTTTITTQEQQQIQHVPKEIDGYTLVPRTLPSPASSSSSGGQPQTSYHPYHKHQQQVTQCTFSANLDPFRGLRQELDRFYFQHQQTTTTTTTTNHYHCDNHGVGSQETDAAAYATTRTTAATTTAAPPRQQNPPPPPPPHHNNHHNTATPSSASSSTTSFYNRVSSFGGVVGATAATAAAAAAAAAVTAASAAASGGNSTGVGGVGGGGATSAAAATTPSSDTNNDNNNMNQASGNSGSINNTKGWRRKMETTLLRKFHPSKQQSHEHPPPPVGGHSDAPPNTTTTTTTTPPIVQQPPQHEFYIGYKRRCPDQEDLPALADVMLYYARIPKRYLLLYYYQRQQQEQPPPQEQEQEQEQHHHVASSVQTQAQQPQAQQVNNIRTKNPLRLVAQVAASHVLGDRLLIMGSSSYEQNNENDANQKDAGGGDGDDAVVDSGGNNNIPVSSSSRDSLDATTTATKDNQHASASSGGMAVTDFHSDTNVDKNDPNNNHNDHPMNNDGDGAMSGGGMFVSLDHCIALPAGYDEWSIPKEYQTLYIPPPPVDGNHHHHDDDHHKTQQQTQHITTTTQQQQTTTVPSAQVVSSDNGVAIEAAYYDAKATAMPPIMNNSNNDSKKNTVIHTNAITSVMKSTSNDEEDYSSSPIIATATTTLPDISIVRHIPFHHPSTAADTTTAFNNRNIATNNTADEDHIHDNNNKDKHNSKDDDDDNKGDNGDDDFVYIPILALRRQRIGDNERFHEDPAIIDLAVSYLDPSTGKVVIPSVSSSSDDTTNENDDDDDNVGINSSGGDDTTNNYVIMDDDEDDDTFSLLSKTNWQQAGEEEKENEDIRRTTTTSEEEKIDFFTQDNRGSTATSGTGRRRRRRSSDDSKRQPLQQQASNRDDNCIALLVQRNRPYGFADAAFATKVLDRFPYKNYKSLPLPEEELPMFCYPTGCRLYRAKLCDAPVAQYYGFVVKNERGDNIYVSCVSFFEPLTKTKRQKLATMSMQRKRTSLPHKLFCHNHEHKHGRNHHLYDDGFDDNNYSNNLSNFKDENGNDVCMTTNFLIGFDTMTTFENKTICLISRYPFWTAFRRFLSHLHILSGSSYSAIIDHQQQQEQEQEQDNNNNADNNDDDAYYYSFHDNNNNHHHQDDATTATTNTSTKQQTTSHATTMTMTTATTATTRAFIFLPLERYISHLLLSVPIPKPGGPQIILPLTSLNQPMVLALPPTKDFPLVDLPYQRLMSCLDVPTLVTIVLGFLALENKVIIMSSRPSLVLDACELLRSLLFPFELCAPYVPRLTEPFMSCLEFPGAIFVGIHDDGSATGLASIVRKNPPEDCAIVDLDYDRIDFFPEERYDVLSSTWNIIPNSARSMLVSELETLCRDAGIVPGQEPLDSLVDSAFDVTIPSGLVEDLDLVDHESSSCEPLDDRAIRDAFLRFFCSLMGGYERYLVVPDVDFLISGNEWFDATGFLSSATKENSAYLNRLVSTQLFQSFIQRRTEASDVHCLLFDECVSEYHSSPMPYGRLGGDVETVTSPEHNNGQPQMLYSLLVDQSAAPPYNFIGSNNNHYAQQQQQQHDQLGITSERSMDYGDSTAAGAAKYTVSSSMSMTDISIRYSEYTMDPSSGDIITAPSRQDLPEGVRFVYCVDGNPCFPHRLNPDLFLPREPDSWLVEMSNNRSTKTSTACLARSEQEAEEANRRRKMATSYRGLHNQRRCLWQLPKLMGSHFLGTWLLCVPAQVSQPHLSHEQQSRYLLRALGALRLLRSKQRIVPDEAAYRALIVACGRTNSDRRVELVKLFGLLRSDGIFPSAVTLGQYTRALAEGYSKRSTGGMPEDDFSGTLEAAAESSAYGINGPVDWRLGAVRDGTLDMKSALFAMDENLTNLENSGRKWRQRSNNQDRSNASGGQKRGSEQGGNGGGGGRGGPTVTSAADGPVNQSGSEDRHKKRSNKSWLPVVFSSSFVPTTNNLPHEETAATVPSTVSPEDIRLVAIWSRTRSCNSCAYTPLEEEIQAGWDMPGGESEVPGAVACPRCGALIIPMLAYRDMSISEALADGSRESNPRDGTNIADFAHLPPQIGPFTDNVSDEDNVSYVTYVSPSTLRLSMERYIEDFDDEDVLSRDRLRDLDPELYYNFWWYCARFSLPLPLPVVAVNGAQPKHYCAFVSWDRTVAERGCFSGAKAILSLLGSREIDFRKAEGRNPPSGKTPVVSNNADDSYEEFPVLGRFNLQNFFPTVWDHSDLSEILVALVEACDKRDFKTVVECVLRCNKRRRNIFANVVSTDTNSDIVLNDSVDGELPDPLSPSVELECYRTILYLAKYQCTTAFHAFFPATLKPCKGYHFWCAMGTPLPIFDRLLREAVKRIHSKEITSSFSPLHDVSDVALGFRCVFGHLI